MEKKRSKILVVDDNPEIREILKILLEGEGFAVQEAGDGGRALEALGRELFDLIILDIMMPGMNGYQTCLEIRKISNAPILFLSARTKDSDKTLGFSSGGDDYLAKPFSYSELVWRVRALLRRSQIYSAGASPQGAAEQRTAEGLPETEVQRETAGARETGVKKETAGARETGVQKETAGTYETGAWTGATGSASGAAAQRRPLVYRHLTIDEDREEVYSNGTPLDLTSTEYAVLHLLVRNRRQIFSADRLYEAVWNEPYYYGANNTVMVHIRNLRRKIEKDPANPELIRTVWGKGYRCE